MAPVLAYRTMHIKYNEIAGMLLLERISSNTRSSIIGMTREKEKLVSLSFLHWLHQQTNCVITSSSEL